MVEGMIFYNNFLYLRLRVLIWHSNGSNRVTMQLLLQATRLTLPPIPRTLEDQTQTNITKSRHFLLDPTKEVVLLLVNVFDMLLPITKILF